MLGRYLAEIIVCLSVCVVKLLLPWQQKGHSTHTPHAMLPEFHQELQEASVYRYLTSLYLPVKLSSYN